ncbi:MAG TPA: hypothetical protein VNE62_01360 [Actinomycetota bacterium]|nr:hypothetical protein [Actinomycetota bacterium]
MRRLQDLSSGVARDAFKITTYLAMALIGLGFLFIFVAWNGAANLDHTPGQIPYLISGGVGGLSLILVGLSIIFIQSTKRDRVALEERLRELGEVLERVQAAAPVAVTPAGRAAPKASRNGLVVAGSSSYHRPDCRLASGREGADVVSSGEARDRGLAPCRICKP